MAKYVKPILDTKFHIDFSWWQKKGQNLRAHLESHICEECKDSLHGPDQDEVIDWVDPDTGEVFQINMLWYIICTHCSQDPSFIDERTPLTTAIFRVFIANNNTPLTPTEIHQVLQKKTPELILRTIGGRQVYQGIRAVVASA